MLVKIYLLIIILLIVTFATVSYSAHQQYTHYQTLQALNNVYIALDSVHWSPHDQRILRNSLIVLEECVKDYNRR